MIKNYLKYIQQNAPLSSQEALWLLQHIQGADHLSNILLTHDQQHQLDLALDQIKNHHKPLSYIIGWVPFLNLKLNVKSPILIPRPETEAWIDTLIQQLKPHADTIHHVLDIGTGSGAIALAIAQAFPHMHVMAIDINPQALALAQENAELNYIRNVTFVHSNLFDALRNKQFDLIVSNPPYIPHQAVTELDPSVRDWEDHNALFADDHGTKILHDIIQQTPQSLKLNDALPYHLVLEIDRSQHQMIQEIAGKYGFTCEVTQDLFGNWRTAWCKFTKKRITF